LIQKQFLTFIKRWAGKTVKARVLFITWLSKAATAPKPYT